MLKITVKITEADALDFLIKNYDASNSQKNKKKKSRFFIGLLFLIIAFYFLFTDAQKMAILFLFLSLFWYFIIPYYLRSAVISTYKEHVKNKLGMILNKPISFELREKGIFVKYDLEEATYLYDTIQGISRVGRNIYIDHKGRVPLIIPYSDHKEAIDTFIASLEERLKALNEN